MEDVVIAGVGLTTAVGLSAPETAAAVRAAMMRFEPIAYHDRQFQPFTVAQVPEDGLPPLAPALASLRLTPRVARMLRLATAPLAECVAALPATERKPPLVLALPETETTLPMDGAAFLAALAAQTDGAFEPAGSDASRRGRAGGLAAVGAAVQAVRSGRLRFALAGGVETYRDLHVLGTLDRDRRVKSAANPDGFIPGEGAAFLLVTTRGAAQAAGLAPLASLAAAAEAVEPGHLHSAEPYRGDGLAAAVAGALAQARPRTAVREVYSTMNGESHWAKEWGVAFLRSHGGIASDHGMHHPADCYGDPGAAAGPLLVALAALGLRGGYRQAPSLVYASSDAGPRAALVLDV
ncbi:MAG TPA: beta-ketoacyl synthase N-terminal-like domain-containing protein [Longimicrobiales bacterium]|nr:beta-ketoacyl synthase N-terminal-like domain-containing protein [Longimicrobiales bacterium]